jgi:hypothetical protein
VEGVFLVIQVPGFIWSQVKLILQTPLKVRYFTSDDEISPIGRVSSDKYKQDNTAENSTGGVDVRSVVEIERVNLCSE